MSSYSFSESPSISCQAAAQCDAARQFIDTAKNHFLSGHSKVMKSKRAKAAGRPISGGKKPGFEQCWYCELNADAGAEAAIILTKPDNDFQYFIPEPDEGISLVTHVTIPRCVECKIAHDKFGNLGWAMLFFCLIACALLGVYFGIYEKTLSWWGFLASALGVSGSVIGIAIGIKHNFFMLPDNIKRVDDVEKEPQVQALVSKGWTIKR
jgi:hypothetical protein